MRKSVLKGFDPQSVEAQDSKTIKDGIAKKLKKVHAQQRNKERALSPHVTTRWYRSPEVCLMEKNYDQACDIWALGCTFLELFTCHQMIKLKPDRRTPFLMGTSCYPLSPKKGSKPDQTDVEERD